MWRGKKKTFLCWQHCRGHHEGAEWQHLSADRISHLNQAEFIEFRDVNFLIVRASTSYCNSSLHKSIVQIPSKGINSNSRVISSSAFHDFNVKPPSSTSAEITYILRHIPPCSSLTRFNIPNRR